MIYVFQILQVARNGACCFNCQDDGDHVPRYLFYTYFQFPTTDITPSTAYMVRLSDIGGQEGKEGLCRRPSWVRRCEAKLCRGVVGMQITIHNFQCRCNRNMLYD